MIRKKEVKETEETKEMKAGKRTSAKKKIPKETTAARANKKTSEGKSLPKEDLCKSPEIQTRIREVAYYRYVNRGRIPGYELSDWMEAEKIVMEQAGGLSKSQA